MGKLGLFAMLIAVCLNQDIPVDACKSVPEILTTHGYISAFYNVTTNEGYILGIFRIIGKIGENKHNGERTPLVMQHGISASANNFLNNGKNSPAIYFYDQGFDVWLPSVRGSRYSKDHKWLNNESEEYWNFTFEELGTQDTKAFLDFIYNATKKKVLYLGFSQGFMQLMAGFSLDPEFFQSRISKILGWAPIVRVDMMINIGYILGAYSRGIKLFPLFGVTHTGRFNYDDCIAGVRDCVSSPIICKIKLIISSDMLPYYDNDAAQIEGGDSTSIKNQEHLAFNIINKGFYRYPLNGRRETYDLSKVTKVPLGIVVGEADTMCSVANGKWIEEEFKRNGNLKMAKYYKYMGHKTFLIAKSRFEYLEDSLKYLNEP